MTSPPRRNSRAHSIVSDKGNSAPPLPSATRRSGTRGVRAESLTSDALSTDPQKTTQLPPHYFLSPTVPGPFTGTLEASLDAILSWGALHASTTSVKEMLLRPVTTSTDWPAILMTAFGPTSSLDGNIRRLLLEELIFLVTRTLLPEQIAENRLTMGRLYERKKQLAIRFVLRYDMLREWTLGEGPVGKRDLSVFSVPPTASPSRKERRNEPVDSPLDQGSDGGTSDAWYKRPVLMPNIWPTLIAAPAGGYTTQGVRERMKHYVTPLDDYLLLKDDEVRDWSENSLIIRASQIVLQWQWLRQKNETLEEMEDNGWEELEGRAEECEWIAEKKEGVWGKGKLNEDAV